MAQVTIEYDARNQAAKKAIDLFVSLGLFKVKSTDNAKNTNETIPGLDKSLKEAKAGKVNKYDSVEDFFKKIS